MWWIVGGIVMALLWAAIRWGGKEARFVNQTLAKAIEVQPHLVHKMVGRMGLQRTQLLAGELQESLETALPGAINALFIYQVFINSNPHNVAWWKERLRKHGFKPNVDERSVEEARLYLLEAGFDFESSYGFLDSYRRNFAEG